MPRKSNKEKDNIEEKLEYLGLDFDNIPESFKDPDPLEFRVTQSYDEGKYKQYRYIPVKDIELLLSPTNRLDELKEKYAQASDIYSYLVPDKKENILRHTTFLTMLKNMKIEDIENVEKEQKELNKKIPFKVKYPGNYLWQIYYSENADKYFMLVPTEDSDYSAFFYVLKKQLEKKRAGKVFVPISHVDYSSEYLKKSNFEDIENYLWLFTKDWPMVYEVYDKKDNITIQIVGETNIYGNIKTPYKIVLNDKEEAAKFYKLIKALFMIQTEAPHYYKFTTNIDKKGSLEFFYEDKKIDYDNLADFIRDEYIEVDKMQEEVEEHLIELEDKLQNLKILASTLELDYVSKERQISTYLECKKTFFGKVKYFFKYKKSKGKGKNKGIAQKAEENTEPEEKVQPRARRDTMPKIPKTYKKHYTLEELIDKSSECYIAETEMKNCSMDINAIKLRNKNLEKKIENATAYIAEIDSHKKSIFEFWKYSNKDEMSSLPEGEIEEVNVKKKVSRIFDYKEDLEDFGVAMDKQQRKELTPQELDSVFVTTTEALDLLNKIKTNTALPKEMESALKLLKSEAKSEKDIPEEEFDVFGGKVDDGTKIKKIANKKHREMPKDKYKILEISKGTKQLGYKLRLETILNDVENAISKIKITENIPIYFATSESDIDKNILNIFNLNPEKEIKRALAQNDTQINLFKINLPRNTNAIAYTNSVFYDNKNKTLPLGMDLSTKILFDTSSVHLKPENKRSFRVVSFPKKDDLSSIVIKTINVIEYNIDDNVDEEPKTEVEEKVELIIEEPDAKKAPAKKKATTKTTAKTTAGSKKTGATKVAATKATKAKTTATKSSTKTKTSATKKSTTKKATTAKKTTTKKAATKKVEAAKTTKKSATSSKAKK